MNYIVKYFWSLGIIFTAVNAFILKSKMSAIDSPEESAEQKKIIAGYFSFLAIPCFCKSFNCWEIIEPPYISFTGIFQIRFIGAGFVPCC